MLPILLGVRGGRAFLATGNGVALVIGRGCGRDPLVTGDRAPLVTGCGAFLATGGGGAFLATGGGGRAPLVTGGGCAFLAAGGGCAFLATGGGGAFLATGGGGGTAGCNVGTVDTGGRDDIRGHGGVPDGCCISFVTDGRGGVFISLGLRLTGCVIELSGFIGWFISIATGFRFSRRWVLPFLDNLCDLLEFGDFVLLNLENVGLGCFDLFILIEGVVNISEFLRLLILFFFVRLIDVDATFGDFVDDFLDDVWFSNTVLLIS